MPSVTIVANTPAKAIASGRPAATTPPNTIAMTISAIGNEISSARCASFSARSENSRSTSSSPPTSTFGASMPRRIGSTASTARLSASSLRFGASCTPIATTSPSALGPCWTDATSGTASSAAIVASGTGAPWTIAATSRSLRRRAGTSSIPHLLRLERLRTVEVAVELREQRAGGREAEQHDRYPGHDDETRTAERNGSEPLKHASERAPDPAEKSSDASAIRNVRPWSDPRYRPRTRR